VADCGRSTLVNSGALFAISRVELLASTSALARTSRSTDGIVIAVARVGLAVVDGNTGLAIAGEARKAQAGAVARCRVPAGSIITAVTIVAFTRVDFNTARDVIFDGLDVSFVAVARVCRPAAVRGDLANLCGIAHRVGGAPSENPALTRFGRGDLASGDGLARLAITREAPPASDRR
jgi:hypothetical protein